LDEPKGETQMVDVLVIEDNEDNMDLVYAFLEDIYNLKGCYDSYEVMALFESDPSYKPDVILCDISLPGMDGVELVRVIHQHQQWKGVPVIALTSHAMKGDREKFMAAGFDDYIPKPIMGEEMLCEPINRLLKR